jgi:hypothetical protein
MPTLLAAQLSHSHCMPAPLRTDLNDFLFAPIADDANGMPLTLLSALARLGIDPWAEAADLADQSRDSATKKLVALLSGVRNGPSPGADTETLAARLVALLHPASKLRAAVDGATSLPAAVAIPPRRVKLAIYYLLALLLMFVGQWALTSRHAPTPTGTSQPTSR